MAENLNWVSVKKMRALVQVNLYYVTPAGDQAKPNLEYCRPDAPKYRRVYGAGWERVEQTAKEN